MLFSIESQAMVVRTAKRDFRARVVLKTFLEAAEEVIAIIQGADPDSKLAGSDIRLVNPWWRFGASQTKVPLKDIQEIRRLWIKPPYTLDEKVSVGSCLCFKVLGTTVALSVRQLWLSFNDVKPGTYVCRRYYDWVGLTIRPENSNLLELFTRKYPDVH